MTVQRHIHLDAVGGIAGDMFVAALLDALPELQERVLADIAAVLPHDCGRAVLSHGMSGGLRTLRFRLATSRDEQVSRKRHDAGLNAVAHSHTLPHRLDDRPSPVQLDHDVAIASPCGAKPAPQDGSYGALVELIRGATLHVRTADAAVAILTHVARAEARIHGVQLEDVHFHELADWDSLMDVVAAGSITAALEGTCWSVSDLPLGGGQVNTRHGRLPVPSPAAAELLKGFRWRDDGITGERVTPTGAAILRYLVPSDDAGPPAHGRLAAIGTGGGTRELSGTPNILRVLVFELQQTPAAERVAVISFDVDDMTGEEIGVAADRLRAEAGVLDVSLATRIGKKSRPMTSFRLLVDPGALETVQRRCFSETSTIGLRWRAEERRTLARQMTTATMTDGSSVRVKHALHSAGDTSRKAESDDLQGIEGLQARRSHKAQAENGSE